MAVKIVTVSICLLIILSLFIGCVNPFAHRDSEDPSGRQGHWEVPSSPEVVVDNLRWAYEEMIIENYTTCFADSFHFSASPQDSASYPETFSNWDLNKETTVTNAVFSSDSITLTFEPDSTHPDIEDDIAGLAELHRLYNLVVTPSLNATVDSPALGVAYFYMERGEDGNWSMYNWADYPDTTGGSVGWGLLKAEFE